tara:strand:- start:4725 stop:5054 length:330 start_codon:yes stop_codon:yes gene_type:complete
MFKTRFVISIFVFFLLMLFTAYLKTKTMIIEKKIVKLEREIIVKKNDLYEAQLDFYYLSSPDYIYDKVMKFTNNNYVLMDIKNIYYNYEDFLKEENKNYITRNDKKKEK